MDKLMKFGTKIFIAAIFFIFSFLTFADTKLYVITDPDRSRVYVDGLFRGTYSRFHEHPLEIFVRPGKHTIEAIKLGNDPVLSYQIKELTVEPDEWRIVRLELREHKESKSLNKTQINVDDFITVPLPKNYAERRLKQKSPFTTAREEQQKEEFPALQVIRPYNISLDNSLKYYARRYNALRAREEALKQQRVIYSLTTPPPGMVEIPGGVFCDPAEPECKSVDIKAFWIAEKEVTVKQWRECVQSGTCPNLPGAINATNPEQAMSGISYTDAKKFLQWLKISNGIYARLPTDIEWKYAAYANRKTKFPWGDRPQMLSINTWIPT
jgi:hypothetical protein